MGDTLEIFGKEFTNVAGFKAKDDNGNTLTYTRGGSGGGVIISDTTDSHGGTIRTITTQNAVTLQTKTITPTSSQQIVNPDTGYDGFSSVTVEAGGGSTPSVTHHTINLEFSDGTDVDIDAYYNDTLIGTMITSYTPNPWTYNNKTVLVASLDNTEWINRSTTWETLLDTTNVGWYQSGSGEEDTYPYCWIQALGDYSVTLGSQWRVTWNGTEYVVYGVTNGGSTEFPNNGIGNPKWVHGTDNGVNAPFFIGNYGYGAWSGGADLDNSIANQSVTMKIERVVIA